MIYEGLVMRDLGNGQVHVTMSRAMKPETYYEIVALLVANEPRRTNITVETLDKLAEEFDSLPDEAT